MVYRPGQVLENLAQAVRFYPNPGLYEAPGLARLAVGGPADGRVLSTQEYVLEIKTASGGEGHYSMAEIGLLNVGDYRTWRLAGMGPEEHYAAAVRLLVESDPQVGKMVRRGAWPE